MNSKEEILKKHIIQIGVKYGVSNKAVSEELQAERELNYEFYSAIESAMTEYRSIGEREAAIGFAEWKEDNGYVRVNSIQLKKSAWVNTFKERVLINGSDLHYTYLVEQFGITTEQLYEIYKQSL